MAAEGSASQLDSPLFLQVDPECLFRKEAGRHPLFPKDLLGVVLPFVHTGE